MKACAVCGKEVEESELYTSGNGEVCGSCHLDDELPKPGLPISPIAMVALAGGVVPFFASFSTSSSATVNGVITGSHTDYVAIGGGAVAVLVGLVATVLGLKAANKAMGIGAPLLAVLLGVYQLLRGFGVL